MFQSPPKHLHTHIHTYIYLTYPVPQPKSLVAGWTPNDIVIIKVVIANSSPQECNHCHYVVKCYGTGIMLYSLFPMALLLFILQLIGVLAYFPIATLVPYYIARKFNLRESKIHPEHFIVVYNNTYGDPLLNQIRQYFCDWAIWRSAAKFNPCQYFQLYYYFSICSKRAFTGMYQFNAAGLICLILSSTMYKLVFITEIVHTIQVGYMSIAPPTFYFSLFPPSPPLLSVCVCVSILHVCVKNPRVITSGLAIIPGSCVSLPPPPILL